MSTTERIPSAPAVVYRCFDKDDRLLYVGCTGDWQRRLWQHRSNTPFWPEVVAVTFAGYPTRDEALQAESRAIDTESPIHNVQPGVAFDAPEAVRLRNAQRAIRKATEDRDAAIRELRSLDKPWGLDRLAAAAEMPKSSMQRIVQRLET